MGFVSLSSCLRLIHPDLWVSNSLEKGDAPNFSQCLSAQKILLQGPRRPQLHVCC